jgi:hypothetical protein
MSTGLLLYSDDGLLPALTLILTIEMGALGLGLWSAPLPVGGGAVEQLRLRWLFCLVTFALGATVAAAFNVTSAVPRNGLGQGVGLALLGALPLFSVGTLLGAMSRSGDSDRGYRSTAATPTVVSPPTAVTSPPAVGPPAVIGAGIGFLLAGGLLIPITAPYTLYLFCLVILSAGALLQGWALDDHLEVEVLETVQGPVGELRMERRALGVSRRDLRVLLEVGRIRGAEDAEGGPGRDWEVAILEGMAEQDARPESVLYLGGGSGTLVRLLTQRFPHARIHVVERSRELVDLARNHFTDWDGWESIGLTLADPLEAAFATAEPFSVTIVDGGALPSLGNVPVLKDPDWRYLAGTLTKGGVLVIGGLATRKVPDSQDPTGGLGEILENGRRWVGEALLFRKEPQLAGGRLLREAAGWIESLLVFSAPDAPAFRPEAPGFRPVTLPGAPGSNGSTEMRSDPARPFGVEPDPEAQAEGEA